MEDTVNVSHQVAIHYGASVRGDAFEQTQQHLDQQENPVGMERSLDGLQTISSAYGSLRLRPIDPVSLTLGGRLDSVRAAALDRLQSASSDTGTLFSASPRLTSEWRVFDPWQLFFSYGRGFRPPEARAFSSYEPPRTGIAEELYDGGEPSMTLSDSLELGTHIQASRHLGVMASGFATFIAREAVFDHVSGINLELNRTRRLGGELDLRYTPTGWLLLSADATLVDARFVESGNLVPFAPWFSGSVRAVVTHPSGWRGGMRFFGLAPRPLPHGARGAAMAVLDASLGYHWEHFHLDLEVENLLNQRVREGEYHHASNWDPEESASQIPVIHTVAGPPLNARLGFTVVY
jgi:outer membrane receptor protein involved in Fe transport